MLAVPDTIPWGGDALPFTVLFDWNGTLVDDADRAWRATDQVLLDHGLDATGPVEFGRRFRLPLGNYFGGLGIASPDVESAIVAWNDILFSGPPRESAGALATLEALQASGHRLGVISAASRSGVSHDLRRLGWAHLFDAVIADAAPKRLPIAEFVRCSAGPVIYVGDTEYDIAESRDAGAIAVGYTGGYRPRAAIVRAGPDRIIDELGQLPPMISGGALSHGR